MTELDNLSEPFPEQVLGTLNKGGRRFTFVPAAEVIVRLNSVLGANGWSVTILSTWRDQVEPDWVLAHVRLTAYIDGREVVKEQMGGQKIKKLSGKSEAVDIGDEYKGAVSDALKKCAQQLGVGIELSRKDEAIRYDERQQ